uniref:Uncharacterized protein n=1 Tax=Podarcis muralis TaxID=64176 RepID=A0A670JZ48_PODMU
MSLAHWRFMFPVAGGLGPQGMIPMQQQGFSMVSVMQPNMQGMIGMNYGSQMPPGTMTMQGGMNLGPDASGWMSYMGAGSLLRNAPQQLLSTPRTCGSSLWKSNRNDMNTSKSFSKRKEKGASLKSRNKKLRLLSSVKPKMGEKSRDDALEAIKGNLDGFSRDAKLHPTPTSHPKNSDHPTPSHSLCLSPKPLPFLTMTSLVTLYRGLSKTPRHSCLPPLPSLFSLAILPPRLGNGFQRRLWPSLSLQPRFQCPPSFMAPGGRFLISLLLQLHKTLRKQALPWKRSPCHPVG